MKDPLDKINVKKLIDREDFETLFTAQLDLTPEEIERIHNVYYPTYTTFITNEVSYVDAWIAIRNLFVSQETQIGERHGN